MEKTRRMIGTYPFKYTLTSPENYFRLDKAALYIHVPFCLNKCHFCTYISIVNSTEEMRERYVQAVCNEIERFSEISCYPKYDIEALYFGGGTPSILSSEQLERILNTCKKHFNFLDGLEMCMEFDPSTVTDEKLETFTRLGFTRASLGIQSFNDDVLKAGNRSHNAEGAYIAVEKFKAHGISNFNLDLIYPLQLQTKEIWENDLREAIRLEPAGITAHVLEVWPNTKMEKLVKENVYQMPTFDEEICMTNDSYDILEKNGFVRWSNCGYYHPARTNHYSVFMEYYWRTYPLIGFGVSAKSVLGQRVYTNVFSFNEYIKKIESGEHPLGPSVIMSKRQEMLRVIIRGLKACYIDKNYFYDRFGVELSCVFGNEIQQLLDKDWIINLPERIELTRLGQVYDRDVYSVFYTDDDLRSPTEGEISMGLSLGIKQ